MYHESQANRVCVCVLLPMNSKH